MTKQSVDVALVDSMIGALRTADEHLARIGVAPSHETRLAIKNGLLGEGQVGYKLPEKYKIVEQAIFVGRGSAKSRRLYSKEEKLHDQVKEIAELLSAINMEERGSKLDFWTESLPNILWSLLDSYDRNASYAAAKGFVKWMDEKARRG